MSWSEVKLLKDRLNAGTRALPLLIIEDGLSNLGGKTLTITNGIYTHTVGFPQGESILPVTLECLGDWSVSYTDNGNTVTQTVTVNKVGGVKFSFLNIVSWANGTDAEIVQMVAYADNGIINLSDYWNVGDERIVHLDAMSATGVDESHVAQDVSFVLMHQGLYELVTPVLNKDGTTRNTCSFIVGMKNCLLEKGYINATATNSGSWNSCARRTWCNSVFKNSIPETFRNIFKQFKTITATEWNASSTTTSQDYFALPAGKEVWGADGNGGGGYSNSTEGAALTQFEWYATSSNRIKKLGNTGSAEYWWERSPRNSRNDATCSATSDGINPSSNYSNVNNGISPFGVI